MMPTYPTPYFIMREPDLTFGLLEHLFDPMALRSGSHEFAQRHVGRRVGQDIVRLRIRAHGANHEQSLFRADPTLMLGLDPRENRIDFQRSFLTVSDRQPSPTRGRLSRGPIVGTAETNLTFAADSRLLARGTALLQIADQRVARHVKNVAFATLAELSAELGDTTELVIGRDPTVRQARATSIQQIQGDSPLFREDDLIRDVALGPTRGVGRPVLG